MSHIFKPTYTRKIPATAEKCSFRSVPAVRWKGRNGRWVYGILSNSKPGRCLIESSVWWIAYLGPDGRQLKKKAGPDRAAAEAMMARLATDARLVAAGLKPAGSSRTFTEAVDLWEADLLNSGRTAKHVEKQANRVRAIGNGVRASTPADLTPPAVRKWVADQQRAAVFGSTTANNYVGAAKQFTRWLCVTDKTEPTDHLAALSRESDETDLRHVRRALDHATFDTLIQATGAGGIVRGLSGAERVALYMIAASTGLRASELASLTSSCFSVESPPFTVVVAAAYSKRRRRDTLPVPSEVVKLLTPLIANARTGPVWPDRLKSPHEAWNKNGAKMLRVDLKAAGIPYRDAEGRVYDFHALRSQFGTDLDRAGVSLARAQRLMRHSTPLLTSRYYTRPDAEELAEDVEKLRKKRP